MTPSAMGGTLASTLAGEYSFTIGVAFALLFFGTFAIALRTRRRLWLPAVFLAACLMSHLVVGIFVAFGAFAVWLFQHPLKSATRAISIGGVGVLLSAVWSLPLIVTLKYTTNMLIDEAETVDDTEHARLLAKAEADGVQPTFTESEAGRTTP